MLRLCKKCSSKLKQIDANDNFTTWECENPDCREVFTFPVEKIIEEDKKVEEEKFVINVPKLNKDSKTIIETKAVVKPMSNNSLNIGNMKGSKDTKLNDNKEENLDPATLINKRIEEKKLQLANEIKQNINANISNKNKSEKNSEENKDSITNNDNNEKLENQNLKNNETKINEEKSETQVKKENLIIDNELDSLVIDEQNDEVNENEQGEYDPYGIDFDAEDAQYPLTSVEETQYTIEASPNRIYPPIKFVCPFCSSAKFGVSLKLTQCMNCGNKYLNLKLESELYYALTEANNLRQMANFKDAENIIKEMIDRYPKEDLTDAYFALGIAQSNIIFRENIKTKKKFVTVYEPFETPFLENQNIVKALNLAMLQSKIKYDTLKGIADEIDSYCKSFKQIANQNGRYTVFICYHQNENAHIFTKDLLKNMSKITRTFVVGNINEAIDDNRDLMSKIYYGINSSKIMVLLCTSKEDLVSSNLVWRYRSFLSINREKYVIPVLMNGLTKEDLPQELQRFEPIIWDSSVILNIQKQIHRLLPQEYINQDFLEDRLNKIEDCLLKERYIEASMRADRLLLNFKNNAYVYFYKLLADNSINEEENLARVHEDLKDNEFFIQAKKYADEDLLNRLIRFEITNTKLQSLRKKEARKEKFKKDMVAFFTKPIMQYVYTTFIPVLIGLIILLTKQPFNNVNFIYLIIAAGVIVCSTLVLISVCKFSGMSMVTMVAAVLFLFGVTCLNRINFMNSYGKLFGYDVNYANSTVCLTAEESILTYLENPSTIRIPETINIYGKTFKITEIGERLFEGCQDVSTIYLSKNITKIHPYAFKDTQADIVFDEDSTMTEIGEYAFCDYKGFHILNIPKTLRVIGDYAFYNCDFMRTLSSNNKFSYAFSLPSTLVSIGKCAFGKVECDVNFAENSTITTLGEYAFSEYANIQLTLPSSLRKIGQYAFYNAKGIIRLSIPKEVTQINASAFEGMINLKYLDTPITQTSVSYSNSSILASYFGGLEKLNQLSSLDLVIYSNLLTLPEYACQNTYILKSLTIFSDTLEKIDRRAFYNCINLEYVNMYSNTIYETNKSIKTIGVETFSGCKNLKNISYYLLPENLEIIGDNAFENCEKLESIIIPESLYDVGINAFNGCNIKTIYILKYSTMENVSTENRFSYNLKQVNKDFGKLFTKVNHIFACESLSDYLGSLITYNFTENSAVVTYTFNYISTRRPFAETETIDTDIIKNLTYNQVVWKIYER